MTTLVKPEKRKKEKVIYLKDDLGSIKYLKELIEGIRSGVVTKFICISDATIDLTIETDMYVVDEQGNKIEDEQVISLTNNYFFGDCPMTALLGLNARMTHILNQYMDNYKYLGDDE